MQTRVVNPYTEGNLQIAKSSKTSVSSLVRGTVIRTDDPLNIGRLKVRVPSVHTGVADEDLPWCMPNSSAASYNSGVFIIPEVNNTVWVAFEDGNIFRPVWLGCAYSGGTSDDVTSVGHTAIPNKRYKRGGTTDTPTEAWDVSKDIVYKASSGAIIYMDNSDSEDSVMVKSATGDKLLLRTGQLQLESADGIAIAIDDAEGTITMGVDQTFSVIDVEKREVTSMNDIIKTTINQLGVKWEFLKGKKAKMTYTDKRFKLQIDEDSYIALYDDEFEVVINGTKISGKGEEINVKTNSSSINLKGDVIDLNATTVNINAEYVNIP